jgi:mercuric ion transport protein
MMIMEGEGIQRVWAAGGITLGAAAAILSCVSPVMTYFGGSMRLGGSRASDLWRPYLPIAAFTLLGLGFFFAYRAARSGVHEPGSARRRPSSVAWSWRILGVATILAIASASFPYYSGWLMRTVGRGSSSDRRLSQRSTARVVLTIEGMDCPICAAGLQNNLRQIPGVHHAEVSFQDKQATLDYDPKAVAPTTFAQVVAQAGFKLGGSVARGE